MSSRQTAITAFFKNRNATERRTTLKVEKITVASNSEEGFSKDDESKTEVDSISASSSASGSKRTKLSLKRRKNSVQTSESENQDHERKGNSAKNKSTRNLSGRKKSKLECVGNNGEENGQDFLEGENISVDQAGSLKEDIRDDDITDATEVNEEKAAPYYLENFKHILTCISNSKSDWRLFSEEEKLYFAQFNELDEKEQKLYIRLFQRKHTWRRPDKMAYLDISDNIETVLNGLLRVGFLEDSTGLNDLNVLLELLPADDLKTLGKSLNLSAVAKNKRDIIRAILGHGSKQRLVFGKTSHFQNRITKKALKILGPCYRLKVEPRDAFLRILLLFSLGTAWDMEEDGTEGTVQLYRLLLVSVGEMVFPDYTVHCKTDLFATRDDLIRFEMARKVEADLIKCMENKDWNQARSKYEIAETNLEELKLSGFTEKDKELPEFLRQFTPGHIYTRCLSYGVEILQRMKQYSKAVELLQELLAQDVYGKSHRGRWWERLALNLDIHLNNQCKALKVIKNGLNDDHVRDHMKYSLYTRVERILSASKSKKLPFALEDFPVVVVKSAPVVHIEGRLIPRSVPGRTHLFMSQDSNVSLDDSGMQVIGVEELALNHYRDNGYPQGIHGEGATFRMLFCLLCWDIIFQNGIPDVFRTSFQAHPLDLNSPEFYRNREQMFREFFAFMKQATVEELEEKIEEAWNKHQGKVCLVQWDYYTLNQAKELIKCFGNEALGKICEKLAKDYRHFRSGVPDLVVWNPSKGTLKVVEVKGPGDILSCKQILWLDYLLSIGVDAEVCYIKAVGAKMLQKSQRS